VNIEWEKVKADTAAKGRCTMQSVQSADSLARCRSSLLKEDRSIVETAIDQEDQDTKIKDDVYFRNIGGLMFFCFLILFDTEISSVSSDNMFEGDNSCAVCKKELDEKERVYRKSLVGKTYTFCKKCLETKKEEVQKILEQD